MSISPLPRWDVSNIYPSLKSIEFDAAFQDTTAQIDYLTNFFIDQLESSNTETAQTKLANITAESLERLNTLLERSGTVRAYIMAFETTNSRDKFARKKMSEFELLDAKILLLIKKFQIWIGKISPVLDGIIANNGTNSLHEFALREAEKNSKFMMSEKEESLAAELNMAGAGAWNKLQGTLTSQLTVEFELDGTTQKLPMPALINLHSHPEETIRHRAYLAEMSVWKTIEEPLAAAINAIKSTSITLNKKRGRKDTLEFSIDETKIDHQTLEAMLSAMRDSFPAFHRYFLTKAKRLGKEKLAWWDIFAPTGKLNRTYKWDQARDLISTNFEKFSPDLAAFSRKAFDNNWIDAEPREGKQGGAFCMSLPQARESRILCNFDGTLDQVITIAHELGHAFHNECAFNAKKTPLQQDSPMTLAETASIMCETIVMQAVLNSTVNPLEKLGILETSLIGDAQVIIDIYSRFIFEKEVLKRREDYELSAEDLCEIIESAQKATYGEGLDERYLMKYMWTWKPHYYSASNPFYNFPYSMGLLFSTGLSAIYQQKGASFLPDYTNLLSKTGEATVAELAGSFGINTREKKFWADSLQVILEKIDLYCQI